MALPAADVATRSQARVGLGIVAEKLAERLPAEQRPAQLRQALDAYLDVFYEKDLRPNETAVPYWLQRAGLDAARLAETLQDWRLAIRIYERLRELLPPLKSSLDKRIARATEQQKMAGP